MRRAANLRPETANPRRQAARRPLVQPRRSVRTDLRPVVPRTHRDPRPAVRALFHLRAAKDALHLVAVGAPTPLLRGAIEAQLVDLRDETSVPPVELTADDENPF